MNATSELTAKQCYQRDYYAKNKARICERKRDIYAADKPRKPKAATVKAKRPQKKKTAGGVIPTPPCKATAPVRLVDKMPRKARHSIEDIQLAKSLGISVEELVS